MGGLAIRAFNPKTEGLARCEVSAIFVDRRIIGRELEATLATPKKNKKSTLSKSAIKRKDAR